MSDFLGEGFDLNLDDILEPDVPVQDPNQNSDGNQDPEGGDSGSDDNKDTKPTSDTKVKEDDEDPDGIDMALAYADADDGKDGKDDKGGDDDEDPAGRTDDDKGSPSSTNIAAYASALFEQGAFPDIDEEEIKSVKTAEDLIELNKKQIEANELKDLTPLQREALNAFRAGIDPTEFVQAKSRELNYENFTDEQLSDDSTAKQIISDYLKLNGTPDDVSEDLIKSYELDEKLEAKAKEVLPKIKTKIKEQNQQRIQEAERQRNEAINQIKTSLGSVKEILPGTQLSKKERDELFNQMTQPAKTLDDGTQLDAVMVKRQEDPVGFMLKLHYYTKLGLFDREVKTDVLKRKVKTDAIREFEQKINQGNNSNNLTGGDPRGRTNEASMFDLDALPDVNPFK